MMSGPSWDLLADLQQLLEFHFMQNALLTGTVVAVLGGAVGYFVVLRGQSFAAHTLSQVGFPGAAAGALLHASPLLGLLAFCTASGLGIGLLGRGLDAGRRSESAAVGTILAFSLGLGLLFFRLYAGAAQGVYSLLFGTILGITDRDVAVTALVAVVALAALAVIARPLLFGSVDPDVALLIFALLVAPGAAAQQLSTRPWLGLSLSVGLAVLFTWAGLAVAYFTIYPVGFFITTFAFGTYLALRLARAAVRARAAA